MAVLRALSSGQTPVVLSEAPRFLYCREKKSSTEEE